MKMKWRDGLFSAAGLLVFCAFCAAGAAMASDVLVGACIYKFDDTFMKGVRRNMVSEMKKLGGELEVADSQNQQPVQDGQVGAFINKGAKALIVNLVNPVDRAVAASLLEKARAANLPIVFLNREPDAEVMKSYDKACYVGTHAEESGRLLGELIVDYFKGHPEADRNGDGKIQYVMLRGGEGQQDAILRTEFSVKAMKDGGFEVEELASETANWDKAQGAERMKGFIASVGLDRIEAVVANNDSMALGAIAALKAEGYNLGDAAKYIPVVGVDATAPALEAMGQGTLLGTVLNDARGQGAAAVRAAFAAAQGRAIDKETVGYEVTDGKYIWIPYMKVTTENFKRLM
nr:galactose ABC transporter substrate-binding protein [uncultured Fretibacterium sp.]